VFINNNLNEGFIHTKAISAPNFHDKQHLIGRTYHRTLKEMKKSIHSSNGCAILCNARQAALGIITYII